MNLTTRMIVVLTVLTMIAGGLLSYWDGFTGPRIEAYRLEQLKLAIAEVLPSHEKYDEISGDGMILYVGKNDSEPEPVVWTRQYQGTRVAFIAQGGLQDWDNPIFLKLVTNSILWAAKQESK